MQPRVLIKRARCLDVIHKAFDKGLMEYGMMTAGKRAASAAPAAPAAA